MCVFHPASPCCSPRLAFCCSPLINVLNSGGGDEHCGETDCVFVDLCTYVWVILACSPTVSVSAAASQLELTLLGNTYTVTLIRTLWFTCFHCMRKKKTAQIHKHTNRVRAIGHNQHFHLSICCSKHFSLPFSCFFSSFTLCTSFSPPSVSCCASSCLYAWLWLCV